MLETITEDVIEEITKFIEYNTFTYVVC